MINIKNNHKPSWVLIVIYNIFKNYQFYLLITKTIFDWIPSRIRLVFVAEVLDQNAIDGNHYEQGYAKKCVISFFFTNDHILNETAVTKFRTYRSIVEEHLTVTNIFNSAHIWIHFRAGKFATRLDFFIKAFTKSFSKTTKAIRAQLNLFSMKVFLECQIESFPPQFEIVEE